LEDGARAAMVDSGKGGESGVEAGRPLRFARWSALLTVFLVNRYFYPDHSATSQHFSDLALGLKRAGLEVTAIASRQHIDNPRARLPASDSWQGVDIWRLGGTAYGRGKFAGRVLDYLSFARAARGFLGRRCRHGDIVIAGTDPPLLGSMVAGPVSARRARLFNWLHDLFPEVAQAMAMRGFNSPAGRLMARWRNRALRAAERNVVLGPHMHQRVLALGVPAGKLHIIHNWADGKALRPVGPRDSALRQEWGLASEFVVGYSGNLGVVHEFETLFGTMRALHHREDIRFLFIGGGKRRDALKEAVQDAGIGNALFKPYQAREALSESLGAADVHLISLRPELEGLVLPSKLYGILAAGRPAIHIGDERGEVASVIADAGCGHSVATGDSGQLTRYISALADDRSEAIRMGQAARAAFDEKYSLDRAMKQWLRLLDA